MPRLGLNGAYYHCQTPLVLQNGQWMVIYLMALEQLIVEDEPNLSHIDLVTLQVLLSTAENDFWSYVRERYEAGCKIKGF